MTGPGDPYERARALMARQPRGASRPDDVADHLRRLCAAVVDGLAASGAGLSVLARGGTRGIVAASDPRSEALEEMQFVLGEGPCIEALARRRPVLVGDVRAVGRTRWPAYAAELLGTGTGAVFAFPLQIGAAELGVLDVFRNEAGPLSTDRVTYALIFADLAVGMLLDAQRISPDGVLAQGLDGAVARGAELFQAQGMVMVQLGLGAADALSRIRAYTFAEGRPLQDVARDIVERRIHFEREPG
jgi:hypothetical protein